MKIIEGCLTCGHRLCAQKVSLFSNLNQEQLTQVIGLIEREVYKKGQVILKSGELIDRLYIVNKGSVKASTYQEDGKEQIIYLLNDGDVIGELSLFKKNAAPYDLIAIKESYLCTIPKRSFDLFLRENPEVVEAVLESAHECIASLERLVSAIASNDADVRLKFLLDRLANQFGKVTSKGIQIDLPLTREDMANFVGVTRETVSRKINDLAQEGYLEMIDSKHILLKRF